MRTEMQRDITENVRNIIFIVYGRENVSDSDLLPKKKTDFWQKHLKNQSILNSSEEKKWRWSFRAIFFFIDMNCGDLHFYVFKNVNFFGYEILRILFSFLFVLNFFFILLLQMMYSMRSHSRCNEEEEAEKKLNFIQAIFFIRWTALGQRWPFWVLDIYILKPSKHSNCHY